MNLPRWIEIALMIPGALTWGIAFAFIATVVFSRPRDPFMNHGTREHTTKTFDEMEKRDILRRYGRDK